MNRSVSFVTGVLAAVATFAACAPDAPDARTLPTRPTTTPAGTAPVVTDAGTEPPGTIPPRVNRGGFGTSRLTFFGDCPDLLGYLQAETLERVTAWGLGGPMWYGPMWADDMAAAESVGGSRAAVPDMAAPQTTAAGSYSTTNTQEVGVDEGDIVETDGAHVYVASQDGVRIIAVGEPRVVATLEVPQGNHQLLLDGGRLLVVTQPWAGGQGTVVSLFDVADATAPALLQRSHLEGHIVAARAVDGMARLVLTSMLADRLPFVRPDTFGMTEERALEANRQVIRDSTIEDWMPRWFPEGADGTFGTMSTSLDCSNVAAPPTFAGLGISWLATVDMRAGATPVGTTGVVSSGETVYASEGNLYLATQSWDAFDAARATGPQEQPPTLIHQFALGSDGSASYVASGKVPGRMLNQFAMSEHEGHLRVAVTEEDWTGATPSRSSVRVLRAEAGELVEVGMVGGLGVTEQIYAVRFLGPTAYVVTFRQVDPLYVVDLSDPTAPRAVGELKIPGYSAYLHPVGDGLLLGVGQDATLEGRTQGTQLSLFDVSDPANPVQLSRLLIGGSSEAEWDHHAFLFWPEDGTIVIPTSPMWGPCPAAARCLADDMRSSGGGVVVAQLQGTELVGRGVIEHDSSTSGCWNPLQRSLVIGAELVTVGLDEVRFTDRASLDTRHIVRWGTAEQYGCVYWG